MLLLCLVSQGLGGRLSCGLEYDDGTQIDVNWTKDPKERFWRSFVGGQPINNGNGIYGENDMVEAISEYVEKLKSQDND